MIRIPLSWMSPAGVRGRLTILIFHRVLPEPDPLEPMLPDSVLFEATMRWVRQWFSVLPLDAAIDRLYAGTVPSRALAITFDDGYADNEALAAPILQRLGLTATFFVASGFLGGGCMWNDRVVEGIRACSAETLDLEAEGLGIFPLASVEARRKAIASIIERIKHLDSPRRQELADKVAAACGGESPRTLMMRPDQVRHLRRMGMGIGAHTRTHPILSKLTREQACEEILGGKAELEDIVGEPVRLFAYPNGVPGQDYAAEHAALVRDCGFSAAVSTAWGAASMRSDRYQLPRFTPWDRERLRYGARLLHNFRRSECVAA